MGREGEVEAGENSVCVCGTGTLALSPIVTGMEAVSAAAWRVWLGSEVR